MKAKEAAFVIVWIYAAICTLRMICSGARLLIDTITNR